MTKLISRSLLTAAIFLAVGATPSLAQNYSLFEKWSVGAEFGWADLSTTMRLDANNFNLGTEIDFENQLGLGNKAIPAITASYKPGRRHELFFAHFKANRDSTKSVATEIRFGDIVIPINADIILQWDTTDTRVGYAYYPMIKQRTALGVGVGLRVQDLKASILIRDTEVYEEAAAVGPLPYIWVEVRHALTPRTRLKSGLGVLAATVGDYSGNQWILDFGIQHQTFKKVAFGGRFDLAKVNVDSTQKNFTGKLVQDVNTVRIFVRARFGKNDYNQVQP